MQFLPVVHATIHRIYVPRCKTIRRTPFGLRLDVSPLDAIGIIIVDVVQVVVIVIAIVVVVVVRICRRSRCLGHRQLGHTLAIAVGIFNKKCIINMTNQTN